MAAAAAMVAALPRGMRGAAAATRGAAAAIPAARRGPSRSRRAALAPLPPSSRCPQLWPAEARATLAALAELATTAPRATEQAILGPGAGRSFPTATWAP
jgi:hypothetical protein